MRRIFWFLPVLFLLSSCGVALFPTPTATPPPTATPTQTLTPTPSATPTITPLPAIPSLTPTLDAREIAIATHAPNAQCPQEYPQLDPTFYVPIQPACAATNRCVFSGTENEIRDFLNQGGDVQAAIYRLQTANHHDYQQYAHEDVTGDHVPDLILIGFNSAGTLHILYCSKGLYRVFSSEKKDEYKSTAQQKIIVQDLNLDGLSEIVFLQAVGETCCVIHVLAWDGQTFQEIAPSAVTDNDGIIIKDIDKNGVKEILAQGVSSLDGFYGSLPLEPEDPTYDVPPVRTFHYVYAWDGKQYTFSSESFEKHAYRFQSLQNADHAILLGKYSGTITLYQNVIFDNTLDWWSPERWAYLTGQTLKGTPISTRPLKDPAEYARLAAYAYYRMVLLHTFLGQTEQAQVKYATLQEKFPADDPGHPYAELAAAFWDAYQSTKSTQKMYDGCAAAIAYADAHPEILTPLGSDYHGWQSHKYVPADVCPFR